MNIVCVKWGGKYSVDYVNILADMVRRNSSSGHIFHCFTDDSTGIDEGIEVHDLPGHLTGWWNKLWLFQHEFEGPVLYLDLDTIVVGSLDFIEELDTDFAILRDFYREDGYGSGVMLWRGDHRYIWDEYQQAGCPEVKFGDQGWMERYELDILQELAPKRFVSYKAGNCDTAPPISAAVVCFHGDPNPHEYPSEWIRFVWQKGGMDGAQFISKNNTDAKKLLKQIKMNRNRAPNVKLEPDNGRTLAIIGGGPSIQQELTDAVFGNFRDKHRVDVWCLNNTLKYCMDRGFVPDGYVMLDARKPNAEFVIPHRHVTYYVASQCHPAVFHKLRSFDVRIWHARVNVGEEDLCDMLITGGGTVGLRALYLAYTQGYRYFHLYGFDSSYQGDAHHAYSQPLNDADKPQPVHAVGRTFHAAPWMIRQARDFQVVSQTLLKHGCDIMVHGDGLIPWIAQHMGGEEAND